MDRVANFIQIDEHSYLDISKIVGFELRQNENSKFQWIFFIDSLNNILKGQAHSFSFDSIDDAMEWINKLFKEKKDDFINSH